VRDWILLTLLTTTTGLLQEGCNFEQQGDEARLCEENGRNLRK
jgi:hypothetical protein